MCFMRRLNAVSAFVVIALSASALWISPTVRAAGVKGLQGQRERTRLDLRYSKTNPSVLVSGTLTPAVNGAEIDVTLQRRKNGEYRTVATRRPALNGAGEFETKLRRPNRGTCKLLAEFPGDKGHRPSSADRTFECGLPVHMIAYSPEQLPARAERSLEKIDGVKATTAMSGSLFLKSSRVPGGERVDNPPGSYTIPLDVTFIEPVEYARFAEESDRKLIKSLRGRRVVLSKGATGLRDGHSRLKMRTTAGRFRSIGSVGNESAQGYEVLISKPAPRKSVAFRTVLIEKPPGVARKRIAQKIRRIANGKSYELGSEKEVPYLRHGQLVRPQLFIKKAFGEFAMRLSSGRSILIQQPWAGQNIKTDGVPILGRVTCHRKLFPQLRKAMRELRRKGLAHTVRESNYAGCFNPRFISSYDNTDVGPVKRISRHAWGIALDINAGNNPFGRRPHQDRRFVRIMKKWGFTWGGKWALPDGMHFEWERFP